MLSALQRPIVLNGTMIPALSMSHLSPTHVRHMVAVIGGSDLRLHFDDLCAIVEAHARHR